MARRGKLEIVRDILIVIQNNRNKIKTTPLLRKSNLSTSRFKEYYEDLVSKGFVEKVIDKKEVYVSLTDKGYKFIEKYRNIVEFIDEFEL